MTAHDGPPPRTIALRALIFFVVSALVGLAVLGVLLDAHREVLASMQVELPIPTQIAVSASAFAARRWYVVLAAIALATTPYFVAKERTTRPYLAAGVVILVVSIFIIPPLIVLPVRALERTLREK